MLVGATGTDPSARLLGLLTTLPTDLAPVAAGAAFRLAPALPGGEVYTDDRAPVEWLVDLSLAAQAH